MTQRLIDQQIALAELALANLRELLTLTSPEPDPEPANDSDCQHPDDKRIDLSAMGITRWKCGCGFSYEKRIG